MAKARQVGEPQSPQFVLGRSLKIWIPVSPILVSFSDWTLLGHPQAGTRSPSSGRANTRKRVPGLPSSEPCSLELPTSRRIHIHGFRQVFWLGVHPQALPSRGIPSGFHELSSPHTAAGPRWNCTIFPFKALPLPVASFLQNRFHSQCRMSFFGDVCYHFIFSRCDGLISDHVDQSWYAQFLSPVSLVGRVVLLSAASASRPCARAPRRLLRIFFG